MKRIWLNYVSYPVTTAVYFERVLKKKYEVITCGPMIDQEIINAWKLENMKLKVTPQDIRLNYDSDIFELYNKTAVLDRPDYFLWIESVPNNYPKNISLLPVPTVCYLIDSHLHLEKHIEWAKNFKFVFTAQKEYLPKFKNAGIKNVFWLPLGCDPEIHDQFSREKKYDIGFVGSIKGNERRIKLLEYLKKFFPVKYERVFWTEMAKIFSESKVVFNNALKNDLNMRVFEVLSTGSFLLTDYPKNSGQDELFINGEDIAVYKDPEIKQVAEFYLENDELRKAIAKRGREIVRNAHKYEHRVTEMMNVVDGRSESTPTAQEWRKRSLKNISVTTDQIEKLKRSFIIPVIDYSPASEYNIKTLLTDLEQINGEVIIIFNSEEVANQIKSHPRIDQYAIMKNNVGVGRAWNIGLQMSRTPLSFIMNSDVHVKEQTIKDLENALINLEKAAIVGPQGGFFHFESAQILHYFDKGTFDQVIEVDDVSGFLFGVKTKYFHEGILKYEPKYTPIYFEEWEMALQVKRAGLKNYIVPTTSYDHHWSGSIKSMKTIKYYDKEETAKQILDRNRLIFWEKWKKIAEGEKENKLLLTSLWVNYILIKSKEAIDNGDIKTAKTIFAELVRLYPKLTVSYLNLGIIYTLEKDFHQAKNYFEKVLSLDQDNKTAKDYLQQFSVANFDQRVN